MAITNPTKYVTTRRLGRFKTKLDNEYAAKSNTYTKTEVDNKISDVDKRYMVEVVNHKAIFSDSSVTVNNHKAIFL